MQSFCKSLINFRNLSHPLQLNCPQDDQTIIPLCSPLVPHPLISHLHHAHVYFTDCCVYFPGRRPSKAMMYFTFDCFLVVQFATRNKETTSPQMFHLSRFYFPTSPQLTLMPTIGWFLLGAALEISLRKKCFQKHFFLSVILQIWYAALIFIKRDFEKIILSCLKCVFLCFYSRFTS